MKRLERLSLKKACDFLEHHEVLVASDGRLTFKCIPFLRLYRIVYNHGNHYELRYESHDLEDAIQEWNLNT
jgi:hypothetical protein